MKRYPLLLIFLISVLFSWAQTRNCGTMEYLEFLKSQDPLLEERMQNNENNLQHWIENHPESSSSTILTIPVVVHVVYYNSNENISTAQVQSQIDILNEDFRRLNTDASNTPSAFQSVAADCEIEFCLATTDPTYPAPPVISILSVIIRLYPYAHLPQHAYNLYAVQYLANTPSLESLLRFGHRLSND